ncbi:MAG: AAA family ATPase [Nocardioidaceae bacterium]
MVDLVVRRSPRLDTTRLIAIDGPAGSGKTSLAGRLSSELSARGLSTAIMHMDDVYEGWTGLDESLTLRVTDQLLKPLAAGRPARWQRYDWDAERFDGWEVLDPPDVLVLEGCGSGAMAYASYTSVLVWVEAPAEVRIERGVARDGEQVLPNWLAWMDVESAHFAANDTKARAEVRLTTG